MTLTWTTEEGWDGPRLRLAWCEGGEPPVPPPPPMGLGVTTAGKLVTEYLHGTRAFASDPSGVGGTVSARLYGELGPARRDAGSSGPHRGQST